MTLLAPAAEAALVLRYTTNSGRIAVIALEGKQPTLWTEHDSVVKVSGLLHFPLVGDLLVPVPMVIHVESLWSYQEPDNGFVFVQGAPEDNDCRGLQGFPPPFARRTLPCPLVNKHHFTGIKPDQRVLVKGEVQWDVQPDGWDAIEITAQGEATFSFGGGGAIGGAGTVVYTAERLLPRPGGDAVTLAAVIPPCPPNLPLWSENAKKCTACPAETPLWVTTTTGGTTTGSCQACPDATPHWDDDKKTCVANPPGTCPERQQWNDDNSECECQPTYYSWRQDSSQPLECLTEDEIVERARQRDPRDPEELVRDDPKGVIWVTFCSRKQRFEETDEGLRIISYLECRNVAFRYKNWQGLDPDRWACHEGLGWKACDQDPTPNLPMPFTPTIDLEETFGPCYFVGSHQVTPCTTGGPQTPTLPDLQVTQLELTNPHLRPGDPVELRARVSNEGGTTAANSELWIHWTAADGVPRLQRLWIGSLPAGASRVLTARSDVNIGQPFTAQAGTLSVQAVADGAGGVLEADELNNERSMSRTVDGGTSGSGPNLRAAWVTAEPEQPVAGSLLQWTYAIDNVGDQTAPESAAEIRITLPDGTQRVVFTSLPSLAPGQVWTRQVSKWVDGSGEIRVEVVADVLDEVPETSELDNSQVHQVTVHDDTACLPCTSGTPNHVGAEQCYDGSGGVPETGSWWRCRGVRFDGSSCVPDGNHPNGWAPVGDRCPPPDTLCSGTLHPDRCGQPGICPGTLSCS